MELNFGQRTKVPKSLPLAGVRLAGLPVFSACRAPPRCFSDDTNARCRTLCGWTACGLVSFGSEGQGVVLQHGGGPGDCDRLGAREAIVFADGGVYYLHYDGAGPKGWRACLATSQDLVHWEKRGPVLDFGLPGSPDSASASSPWVIHESQWWYMFYLGTPHVTPRARLYSHVSISNAHGAQPVAGGHGRSCMPRFRLPHSRELTFRPRPALASL